MHPSDFQPAEEWVDASQAAIEALREIEDLREDSRRSWMEWGKPTDDVDSLLMCFCAVSDE